MRKRKISALKTVKCQARQMLSFLDLQMMRLCFHRERSVGCSSKVFPSALHPATFKCPSRLCSTHHVLTSPFSASGCLVWRTGYSSLVTLDTPPVTNLLKVVPAIVVPCTVLALSTESYLCKGRAISYPSLGPPQHLGLAKGMEWGHKYFQIYSNRVSRVNGYSTRGHRYDFT